MKDLMMILASAAPKGLLIEMLEKALSDYKASQSEDDFRKLATSCMLIAANVSIEESGGLEKSLETMDRMSNGAEMLDPNKFKS